MAKISAAAVIGAMTLGACFHAHAAWSIADLGLRVVPIDINNSGTILTTTGILGGQAGSFVSLNNLGQAVGHTTLYANGVVTPLDPGPYYFSANGISDTGQIIGKACDLSGERPKCTAGLLGSGTVTPLAPWREEADDDTGNAINSSGQAAASLGSYYGNGGPPASTRPTLIDNNIRHSIASRGSASSINEAGHVVGMFVLTPVHPDHPQWRAFVYRDGIRLDLGSLAGPSDPSTTYGNNSAAVDINNHDQVVGWSATRPLSGGAYGDVRAFLWQGGSLINLSEMSFVKAAGWTALTDAYALNDRGQIVGVGLLDGAYHGFVMTIPEPASWLLMFCGVLLLPVLSRRAVAGGHR